MTRYALSMKMLLIEYIFLQLLRLEKFINTMELIFFLTKHSIIYDSKLCRNDMGYQKIYVTKRNSPCYKLLRNEVIRLFIFKPLISYLG